MTPHHDWCLCRISFLVIGILLVGHKVNNPQQATTTKIQTCGTAQNVKPDYDRQKSHLFGLQNVLRRPIFYISAFCFRLGRRQDTGSTRECSRLQRHLQDETLGRPPGCFFSAEGWSYRTSHRSEVLYFTPSKNVLSR